MKKSPEFLKAFNKLVWKFENNIEKFEIYDFKEDLIKAVEEVKSFKEWKKEFWNAIDLLKML